MPVENVLASHGIPRHILIFAEDETGSDDPISFEDGLRSGIAAFLHDEKGTGVGDSPLAAIMAVPEAHGLAVGASAIDCSAKLLEYLRTDSKAEIVLLSPTTLANERYRFLPEQGETINDNWIFRVLLPTAFDILVWSVVNKKGDRPAYCYCVE